MRVILSESTFSSDKVPQKTELRGSKSNGRKKHLTMKLASASHSVVPGSRFGKTPHVKPFDALQNGISLDDENGFLQIFHQGESPKPGVRIEITSDRGKAFNQLARTCNKRTFVRYRPSAAESRR